MIAHIETAKLDTNHTHTHSQGQAEAAIGDEDSGV